MEVLPSRAKQCAWMQRQAEEIYLTNPASSMPNRICLRALVYTWLDNLEQCGNKPDWFKVSDCERMIVFLEALVSKDQ